MSISSFKKPLKINFTKRTCVIQEQILKVVSCEKFHTGVMQ